jgi:hypothetical protein
MVVKEVAAGVHEKALRRAHACRAGAAEAPPTSPAQIHPPGELERLGAPVSTQRLDEEASLVDRRFASLGGLVAAALEPGRRAVAEEAAAPSLDRICSIVV